MGDGARFQAERLQERFLSWIVWPYNEVETGLKLQVPGIDIALVVLRTKRDVAHSYPLSDDLRTERTRT
jgi:hypothetical protein